MPAVEGVATAFRFGWVHEIKHDGYRLMVRRDGVRRGRRQHRVGERRVGRRAEWPLSRTLGPGYALATYVRSHLGVEHALHCRRLAIQP